MIFKQMSHAQTMSLKVKSDSKNTQINSIFEQRLDRQHQTLIPHTVPTLKDLTNCSTEALLLQTAGTTTCLCVCLSLSLSLAEGGVYKRLTYGTE